MSRWRNRRVQTMGSFFYIHHIHYSLTTFCVAFNCVIQFKVSAGHFCICYSVQQTLFLIAISIKYCPGEHFNIGHYYVLHLHVLIGCLLFNVQRHQFQTYQLRIQTNIMKTGQILFTEIRKVWRIGPMYMRSILSFVAAMIDFIFGVLTPLLAIFQLYHGDQFQWWKKPEYPERTTDHGQVTGKLYHLRLRVECTLFCNSQSRARTHAVLVIGLYELLGNPTT